MHQLVDAAIAQVIGEALDALCRLSDVACHSGGLALELPGRGLDRMGETLQGIDATRFLLLGGLLELVSDVGGKLGRLPRRSAPQRLSGVLDVGRQRGGSTRHGLCSVLGGLLDRLWCRPRDLRCILGDGRLQRGFSCSG